MSQYDSLSTERMWQEKWKEWEIYRFDKESERPIYSIDNPPRYTSGSLHLGHATGYSLIDFAARYRRMKGYNVFYPLCFDVNGTPTEVKVEKKYGITKLDLPRTEYRKLCSEYANGFIDEMTHHFEILGQSMDPSIYYQTDAPYYRRITQISFLRLLKMGLAYKGDYPVNWCPRCMTALADAEVEYRDNVTDLNYIRFPLADGEGDVIIATTRPELICTCQTVAVHPEDKDKKGFVGKELITPLYGKKVKIIADPKVDPDYGTGVVMICTIGDKVDLEWVMKYNLPLEKGIDECGHMTPIAGPYEGMKVKEAREAIIRDLKEKGYLIKQEKQKQNVSVCWRCHENIEFLQVPQWFLKTLDFKERVLKRADEVNWFPEFMKIRLRDWVESLEWDWVLSRQRIFATPIPIWECENCGEVVPAEEEQCYVDPTEDDPPVDSCPRCGGNLKGCEDVFDTWMDSSASSLYNCFWERDEVMFKKMFPMSLRPQSHDIIRTWAFYTLLRSEQLTGSIPWRDIMVHGFIMAPDGTPMHSSLGNVIDPLPIIEEYGADALRYYACTCSLGVDHAFREKDVIRGRRFSNKIFNMGNFVGSKVNRKPQRPNNLSAADKWILSRYSEVVKHVDKLFQEYQFDKAMREIESFSWHEFADHYIEMVKHRDDEAARWTLYNVYLGIIKVLAPLMPHVTEDSYQRHFRDQEGDLSIHISSWPEPFEVDRRAIEVGEILKEVISGVRTWKANKRIALNQELASLEIIGTVASLLNGLEKDIMETIKAKEVRIVPSAELEERVVAIKPLHSKIGPQFKEDAKKIIEALGNINPSELYKALSKGPVEIIDGMFLNEEHIEFVKKLMLHGREVETVQIGELLLAIER